MGFLKKAGIVSGSLVVALGAYAAYKFSPLFFAPSYDESLANYSSGTSQVASNFFARDLDGNVKELSDYLEQGPVVMNLWETWCAPCKAEMPYLEQYASENDVTVLAITTDSEGKTSQYVQANNFSSINFLVVDDLVFEEYRKGFIPITLVLDSKGNIAHYVIGKSEFEADDSVPRMVEHLRVN